MTPTQNYSESRYAIVLDMHGMSFSSPEARLSKVPKPFRAHFGLPNSLCIFKTKRSRGTKLYYLFQFL